MAWPENVMAVFRLLDKSNCQQCKEKTCLAFAGSVYQGRRSIAECPRLDAEIIRFYAGDQVRQEQPDEDLFEEMRERVMQLDFRETAVRVGGRCSGNQVIVKVLGKDFGVDRNGKLYSDIHMLPWVIGPFLGYLCDCQGRPLIGEWVSLRELPGGTERYPLFHKRVEQAMQQLADRYTDLFADITAIFQARHVESPFDSDICVILPVLPLVPVMICYWRPDEGMQSSLTVFFDRSAHDNIGIDNVYTVAAGLTQMFEKLALRHGIAVENR